MPAADSPAVIVARFLKANHYTQTLDAFIQEAGLPHDAGATEVGDWTIEQILEEKKQYDVSLNFERRSGDGTRGWTQPAPCEATTIDSVPTSSNVLCVRGATRPTGSSSLFITFADRSLLEVSASSPYPFFTDVAALHNGPILSVCPMGEDHVLSTSMSGQLIVHHPRSYGFGTDVKIAERRSDHTKYAVHVATTKGPQDDWIIATAGWDQKVQIYVTGHIQGDTDSSIYGGLGDPQATLSLPTNPESIIFVRHPDTNALYLVLSRRDSTHLYYYLIDSTSPPHTLKVHEAGKQNLAPHANAWIAFSPSCLALSPTDPSLLAVATSHLPHMKLLIVRLLFPAAASSSSLTPPSQPQATQSTQARAALALSDREDTAIRLHISTLAPQTPYSTPQVVWRPDGSGVWVNGDDGVVRGIEVMTGKVVALLQGHESGTKVRSLWAGMMSVKRQGGDGEETDEEEWLVSGGFDKKVIVWKISGRSEAVNV